MQLLKITTNPLKYELQIERAKLEYNQDLIPTANMQSHAAQLKIEKIENTKVEIDTYEARKSLGQMSAGDSIELNAREGEAHINELTREYVEIGKAMSNVQNSVSIGDVVRSKMLEQPELYTAYLPSAGAELTWSPAQLEISFEPPEAVTDWQIAANQFNFVPGSIELSISEYASINIEYLGGPMYVPPSASPDYDEGGEA